MSSEIITPSNTTIIAGIDDTTKCPCIGSIFIVGVAASQEIIDLWQQQGVKDSKLIAAPKREQLAKLIKETASAVVVREITPAQIDDKSLNLNDWEMLTVLTIAQQLHKKAPFARVHIDNWETSTKGFYTRLAQLTARANQAQLQEKGFNLRAKKIAAMHLVPEHYADENYTVVGAASIIAKVASDKQYKKYKKIYGDFGSGSPADPKTRLFVWQHRHNPLPIIRTSWQTFKTLAVLDSIEDDPLRHKLRAGRIVTGGMLASTEIK